MRTSPARRPPGSSGSHRLLRRMDQVAVAVLVLAGLVSTMAWWVSRGGLTGRLIELQEAPLQTAAFEVDPNTADWPELIQIPGIGEVLAKRIIQSRQTEGPFLDHDELLRVRGIGPRTLERMRPYLRPVPAADDLAGR